MSVEQTICGKKYEVSKLSNIYPELVDIEELKLEEILDWIDNSSKVDTLSDVYVKLYLSFIKKNFPELFVSKKDIKSMIELIRNDCSRLVWTSNFNHLDEELKFYPLLKILKFMEEKYE